MVGNVREIDGFKFCYKICTECGHAVKFYLPGGRLDEHGGQGIPPVEALHGSVRAAIASGEAVRPPRFVSGDPDDRSSRRRRAAAAWLRA